jgi:hypothetical protein
MFMLIVQNRFGVWNYGRGALPKNLEAVTNLIEALKAARAVLVAKENAVVVDESELQKPYIWTEEHKANQRRRVQEGDNNNNNNNNHDNKSCCCF